MAVGRQDSMKWSAVCLGYHNQSWFESRAGRVALNTTSSSHLMKYWSKTVTNAFAVDVSD